MSQIRAKELYKDITEDLGYLADKPHNLNPQVSCVIVKVQELADWVSSIEILNKLRRDEVRIDLNPRDLKEVL